MVYAVFAAVDVREYGDVVFSAFFFDVEEIGGYEVEVLRVEGEHAGEGFDEVSEVTELGLLFLSDCVLLMRRVVGE